MYLAVSTRPDIVYAVSALSQFNVRHGVEHWNATKRVLRYLKPTSNYGLTFKKTGEDLVGYTLMPIGLDAQTTEDLTPATHSFLEMQR